MIYVTNWKKSFSWLRQKVNKKIDGVDVYGHNADDSSSDLCPWAQDDAMSRQHILIPINILIKFEATEYSYSVRIQIC